MLPDEYSVCEYLDPQLKDSNGKLAYQDNRFINTTTSALPARDTHFPPNSRYSSSKYGNEYIISYSSTTDSTPLEVAMNTINSDCLFNSTTDVGGIKDIDIMKSQISTDESEYQGKEKKISVSESSNSVSSQAVLSTPQFEEVVTDHSSSVISQSTVVTTVSTECSDVNKGTAVVPMNSSTENFDQLSQQAPDDDSYLHYN